MSMSSSSEGKFELRRYSSVAKERFELGESEVAGGEREGWERCDERGERVLVLLVGERYESSKPGKERDGGKRVAVGEVWTLSSPSSKVNMSDGRTADMVKVDAKKRG
jgi:hypothetical protein